MLRQLLSAWMDNEATQVQCKTFVLTASGSVSTANMKVKTMSGYFARYIMLPLLAPTVPQQLGLIFGLSQRLRLVNLAAPSKADILNSSWRFKALLGYFSNFRLTSHLLALLGGSIFPQSVVGWSAGTIVCHSSYIHLKF